MSSIIGLFLIGAFAYLILWFEGALKTRTALYTSALLILAAILLRAVCMEHETADYQTFLHKWVEFFRANGGWSAIALNIGNYNVPYLYFLALFSYSGIRDLYLIKLLSVFFDVILAWACMRIVYKFIPRLSYVLAGFFIPLFLPTVVLNGAYWGQCDSIYAAFALWSIYFALDDRPLLSVAAVALSFAFKLQAVFIMPVFLIFIFAGKMKWQHLFVFPATYFAAVLPAILTGRPWKDTLLLYFNQAGSVGSALNYNSSSVFAFVSGDADAGTLSALGIAAASVFLILIFVFCWIQRKRLGNRELLTLSLLICIAVPFLLPHMHDRYFFIADVLSCVFAVVLPCFFLVPLGVSFASLLGYHAYLKMRYLLPMRYGAAALAAVILALIICLCCQVSGIRKKSS